MNGRDRELVKLREKKLTNGSVSLYLDYSSNHQPRYEYLKLYIVPEKTRQDKVRNKATYAKANLIKAQRISELQERMAMDSDRDPSRIYFYEYFLSLAENKRGTTRTSWLNALAYMKKYDSDEDLRLSDITRRWVIGFRDYLDNRANQWDIDSRKRNVDVAPISQGTKALMFQKLVACLNYAVRDGLIAASPAANVSRFREPESVREYLTIDEVRKLATMPCPDEILGKAFMFSCLTGLRWSDIIELNWSQVEDMGGKRRIVFRQRKTSNLEYLDISAQAAALMGEMRKQNDRVFPINISVFLARAYITAWVKAAGIAKHITFHCARHTFAVMMLDLGVDIYTLSKLLGHRSLETTQIYAKILDGKKRAAVDLIPDVLGGMAIGED